MQTNATAHDTDQEQGNGMNSHPNRGSRHKKETMNACMIETSLAVLIALGVALEVRAGESAPTGPVAEALTPLPPGAIQPQGWLRDWAISQRQGLTGHLDEYDQVFALGWTCEPGEIKGAKGADFGWPLEQSAYWIDGALRLGHVLHDEALLAKVVPRLERIAGPDNRTGSFFWWRSELTWEGKDAPAGFKLWSCGVLARALVAQSAATGDPKWLKAVTRFFAPMPIQTWSRFVDVTSRWVHIESLFEAHRSGSDQVVWTNLLAGASQAMVGSKGPLAASLAKWDKEHAAADLTKQGTHGVCFNETAKLPIIYYLGTGDVRFKQAALDRYQYLYDRHMLPYGVNSASEGIFGIGAFRSTETCNVADLIWGTIWMLRAMGDGLYGDRIERAFFNAAPACISRDCTQHSYYQSPNRIDGKRQGVRHAGGRHTFSKTHSPLCCTANITRILPNYVIHMWMKTPDQGLAATLYGPNTVTTTVGGNVALEMVTTTDYPFGEGIQVVVKPAKPARFPLAFRIPGWCAAPELRVNGTAVNVAKDGQGYVRITRDWATGDTVALRFPMPPRVVLGRESEGSPYACVCAGPLLFARAIPEQDENTPKAGDDWKYALDFDAVQPAAAMSIQRAPMPPRWDWPAAAPVTLTVPAQAIDWEPGNTFADALPDTPVSGKGAHRIQLIPYGCAKFRVSMFPVTEKAWGNGPREGAVAP